MSVPLVVMLRVDGVDDTIHSQVYSGDDDRRHLHRDGSRDVPLVLAALGRQGRFVTTRPSCRDHGYIYCRAGLRAGDEPVAAEQCRCLLDCINSHK